MAAQNNVPKEILDVMRETLDRSIKLSIKRLVNYCVKKDKIEKRVLAFSSHRLYIFTAKSAKDVKLETNFHYLDIKSIESKRPNQLVITISLMNRSFTFTTLESDTDEVDHMITHIGTSLKSIFPAFPIERFIKTIEVQPSSRLNLMNDLVRSIEKKETGPCGGFTLMYSCMCEFHSLPYRDEVAWDIDTIYLSQDSRELCLRDFDHLKERDLVPIVSSLVHNTWFTSLNANNVKLSAAVCTEVLRVMKKNSVIEALLLGNTGITTDFIKKLSTLSMSGTQLHKLDLSNNPIEDEGAEHIFGALSSRGRRVTWLDLSKTRVTSKGLNKISESMSRSPHVFSSLQTLILAGLNSGNKGDDLQNLYTFLASPNMISHLDLTGTDVELDKLMTPLQRGCSQNIVVLKLSRTAFSYKKSKEVVVQSSFKQFFASVYALKHIDLSGAKLPSDALKDLLLGISSNRNLKDVHLDISGIDMNNQTAQWLQNCLTGNITSLNISNIGFQDSELVSVLNSIGQKKKVKQLSMGGVFRNTKPKNLKAVMEELVNVLQDEDSVIESLSLADSKLRDSMNMIVNALGSNTSLTEIDISGNQMGDLGARMLSKALQINNKLRTIYWDKNNTTSQGFDDIADALEKNFTLKKMPMPINDASSNPEKAEQALQRIERLLQRNHSPQKYSSDQAYRLQQGFLISSTQQMVDRLVVQSQDTINALESMNALQTCNEDVETTNALIKDADNSKFLLPRLRDIAIQSQNTSSPVAQKLKEISAELTTVIESQMEKTVEDMLEATTRNCKALMKDQAFLSDLQSGCAEKSALPKDFTSNILNDVDTDIFNKLSELNLAVAAHVSDRIIDEVIERLSLSHKTLTNHLNIKKREAGRRSQTSDSKKVDHNDANIRSKGAESQSPVMQLLQVPVNKDSPKMKDKRKSMHARKIRPQSVVDRDHVLIALDAEKNRPVTIPQTSKAGSRSPKSVSPKSPRLKDKSQENDHLKPEKKPRKKQKLLKPSSRSPSTSPRSASPVPSIQVTDIDSGDLDLNHDHLYDNVTPGRKCKKQHGHAREQQDGLDPPVPSISSQPVSSSVPDIDIGNIDLSSNAPKLTHQTKDRARRLKNVRPTTRQSGMPRTQSADALRVDENVDEFFSKPTTPLPKVSEKKEGSPARTPSTKSTPESKKKLGGIFHFGHKDRDHDTKGKEGITLGGFLAKLHGSPKSSPSPKKNRISDVKEESDELSTNDNTSSALTRSTTENTSLRGSMDKKSEKQKEEKTAVPKSASENTSLNGSLGRKSNKSDSFSKKSEDSESLKSNKSGSLDRRSDKSRDRSPVTVSETESEESEKSGEHVIEKSSEKETEKEKEVVKKVEKKPLHPPSTKRSFNKADSKKETSSGPEEKVEEKTVETEESKDIVKDLQEVKETEGEDTEEKNEEKDDKEETKDSDREDDKEPEEEIEEKKPAVTRKPGIPGGIGFGVNIMADLKAQQEKRKSQMPSKPIVRPGDPVEKPGSAEEKKPPFGLHKLKPVSKTVPKDTESDKHSVPVKPSDNKSSEPVKSTESPVQKNRKGSVESDVKNVKAESKTDDKDTTKSSITEASAEKPHVIPRPSGLNKPAPPQRPKPPPPSSKPTPAPRKSLSTENSTENDEEIKKSEKKADEGGVVYDSATLKLSVKDKISKFRGARNETEAGKGKPLLQPEKKESVVKESNSEDSINSRLSGTESPDACDLDLPKVGNSVMTDSGIVADSPKTSVKDALSKFDGKDLGLKKHESLPRNMTQEDVEKEQQEVSKRPKSMFAVVGSRPDLKKPTDESANIPEENDIDSPTEEVILV